MILFANKIGWEFPYITELEAGRVDNRDNELLAEGFARIGNLSKNLQGFFDSNRGESNTFEVKKLHKQRNPYLVRAVHFEYTGDKSKESFLVSEAGDLYANVKGHYVYVPLNWINLSQFDSSHIDLWIGCGRSFHNPISYKPLSKFLFRMNVNRFINQMDLFTKNNNE